MKKILFVLQFFLLNYNLIKCNAEGGHGGGHGGAHGGGHEGGHAGESGHETSAGHGSEGLASDGHTYVDSDGHAISSRSAVSGEIIVLMRFYGHSDHITQGCLVNQTCSFLQNVTSHALAYTENMLTHIENNSLILETLNKVYSINEEIKLMCVSEGFILKPSVFILLLFLFL